MTHLEKGTSRLSMIGTTSSGTLIVLLGMYVLYVHIRVGNDQAPGDSSSSVIQVVPLTSTVSSSDLRRSVTDGAPSRIRGAVITTAGCANPGLAPQRNAQVERDDVTPASA